MIFYSLIAHNCQRLKHMGLPKKNNEQIIATSHRPQYIIIWQSGTLCPKSFTLGNCWEDPQGNHNNPYILGLKTTCFLIETVV